MTTPYHRNTENEYFIPWNLRCVFCTKLVLGNKPSYSVRERKLSFWKSHGGERTWALEARKTWFKWNTVIYQESDFTFLKFGLLVCELLKAAPIWQGFCDHISKWLCRELSLYVEVTQWNDELFPFLCVDLVFQPMYICCFQSWTCWKVDLELFWEYISSNSWDS